MFWGGPGPPVPVISGRLEPTNRRFPARRLYCVTESSLEPGPARTLWLAEPGSGFRHGGFLPMPLAVRLSSRGPVSVGGYSGYRRALLVHHGGLSCRRSHLARLYRSAPGRNLHQGPHLGFECVHGLWADRKSSIGGSSRPRRDRNPFQLLGREAPRRLEWISALPGPAGPQK